MHFQKLLTELMLRFNKFANNCLEFRKLWVDEAHLCWNENPFELCANLLRNLLLQRGIKQSKCSITWNWLEHFKDWWQPKFVWIDNARSGCVWSINFPSINGAAFVCTPIQLCIIDAATKSIYKSLLKCVSYELYMCNGNRVASSDAAIVLSGKCISNFTEFCHHYVTNAQTSDNKLCIQYSKAEQLITIFFFFYLGYARLA